MFLDANGNSALDAGETQTTSATDGTYSFTGLAAGSYRVVQVTATGWMLTAPASGGYSVTLAEGHTVSSADFGNFLTGSINGIKFDDLNANGTREAGEEALAGWTVFLDANANGALDSGEAATTTAVDGSFAFNGIGPGTVQVGEVLPATAGVTWQRTTPAVPYRIRSGFSITADQGDVQLGSIDGSKVNDFNGNGLRDDGELGIAGWTIFLDANGNGVLDAGEVSTLTDGTGKYHFGSLLPGQYVVAEEQRAGWLQTTPLPAASGVRVSTAGSNIAMEAAHGDEIPWAISSSPASVDYGKLSMDTALATTGITQLRSQAPYATLDGRGTTTVVIDTGINLSHPFFGADLDGNGVDDRIVYQHDFANNDDDASDVNGHGSNVSSIIGSQDGLYQGVASGTKLIALKVFDDQGHGTFGYLESALQWVLVNREAYHIGVVNLSLGDNGNWTDQLSRYGIGDELAALAQTDVIVVGAAGNNYLQFGKMGVAYPASDPAVIAVGATWSADFGGPWTVSSGATNYATGADQIAAFSQRSTDLIDTFAPGARFNGANARGGVSTMQGTSQAAAFVSGAAALAQQAAQQTLGRGLTTGEFATLLRGTGDLILDGDDEVDNVVNTGQKFPRLDMVSLVAAIGQLKAPSGGTGGTGEAGSVATPVAQQAAAGVHNIGLAAGAAVTGRDFGNFQLGTVSGTVFTDTDTDGSQGTGEAGRSGVTVYLDANDNGSLDSSERSTVSDASGNYGFANLTPGAAHLRVVLPDGLAGSGAASRSLTVTSGLNATGASFGLKTASTPPVARDDAAAVDEDGAVTIDVRGNDSVAGALGLVLTPGAALHGSVTQQSDGKLLYTPDADYFGADSFAYTLADSQGHSATATVSVTVRPVDDAPLLAAIADRSVAEGATLGIDLSASDVDDTVLSYALLQGPAGATLDAQTGHLSWTAGDQSAAQTFKVQVADPSGLVATRQFSVQVNLGKLVVTGFSDADWGFAVRFNDAVDVAQLNLYGASAPDVAVTNSAGAVVKGSLVVDDDGKGFAFIRTGAQLAADRYQVVIRGAADGVTNARRGALDGNADGSAGGNYGMAFSVAAAPTVRLRLPDFARGPGQSIDLTSAGTGMPVTLTSDGTVTELRLRLRSSPGMLTLTEIRRGANLPADATLTVVPVAGASGQFDITVQRATALPVGSLKLLSLIGSVPTTARLGDAGAIVLERVFVNGVAAPLAADAAVDLVAYPGDADFDGKYTKDDVALVGRIGTGLTTSLSQIVRIDATILADIDSNGVVNVLDTAAVLARTKAASTASIPAIPVLPLAPVAPSTTLSTASTGSDTSPPINLAGTFTNFVLPNSARPVVSAASLRILPSVVSTGAGAGAAA